MLQQLPQLRLQWLDGSGSTAETHITINAILPVSTIESAAPSLVAALSAMTDAVLIRQEIVYPCVPASGYFGPDVGDVRRSGVFVFQDGEDGPVGLVEVPGIMDDVLVADGPGAGVLIVVSDSRVISLVDTLHTYGATNPFGDALGDLLAAYRQSRA